MALLSAAPKCRWARTPRLPAGNYDSPAPSAARTAAASLPPGRVGGIRKKVPPRLRAFFAVAAALLKTLEDADPAGLLPKPEKQQKR